MEENISQEEPVKKDWLKENQPIIEGLKDLNKLLTPQEYRLLGSVVPAALNGKPYRKMHDIDVLMFENTREKAVAGFRQQGYQIESLFGFGNIVGFKPLRFSKNEIVIDIFFGEEDKGGWRYHLRWGLSLYIPSAAWKPCLRLEFGGVPFSAITPTGIYYTISLAQGRQTIVAKDRSSDLAILEKHLNQKELELIEKQKPGLWFGSIYLSLNPLLASLGHIAIIFENALGSLVKH